MDMEKDIHYQSDLLQRVAHSDGGSRVDGRSARAATLTILQKSSTGVLQRTLLVATAIYKQGLTAPQAERAALLLAFNQMKAVNLNGTRHILGAQRLT